MSNYDSIPPVEPLESSDIREEMGLEDEGDREEREAREAQALKEGADVVAAIDNPENDSIIDKLKAERDG